MKYTLILLFCLELVIGCRSKKQADDARKLSGISTETSDIIFSDSAAKQTKGVRVGQAWIVPRHVLTENIEVLPNTRYFNNILNQNALRKTLDGKGPFTLFLPTDAAFEKLGETQWHQFLAKPNNEQRSEFIRLHLVPGKIMTADLQDGAVLKTAADQDLTVHQANGKIYIDKAVIVVKDGVSNNGVIHIIDKVLLPEPD
jgi:uncharacterized surface protein with fasciclin (FAS1) repeats